LPKYIDLPHNVKSIDGILITTSEDVAATTATLKGRLKILSNAFDKPNLPEFDVFTIEKKWNKNMLPITMEIKDIHRQLKVAYEPNITGDKSGVYYINIYLKCKISNDC
jgi:hypothetical protein